MAGWVVRSRGLYQDGKLKEWKITKLTKLGFEFNEIEPMGRSQRGMQN